MIEKLNKLLDELLQDIPEEKVIEFREKIDELFKKEYDIKTIEGVINKTLLYFRVDKKEYLERGREQKYVKISEFMVGFCDMHNVCKNYKLIELINRKRPSEVVYLKNFNKFFETEKNYKSQYLQYEKYLLEC